MKHFAIKSEKGYLHGVIHEIENSIKPIVVIVHGYFTANRVGYGRLYFDIANTLADIGYTTVRFDLSGMGESDGKLEEVVFDNHVADVQNITNFILEKYQRKVILIGHSIGCLVSLKSYCNIPDCFDKLILLSPIFFDDTILLRFFDKDMLKELKGTGHTSRKGICVDYSFFNEQMSLSNVANQLKECKVPIALLIGDLDIYFTNKEIENLEKATGISPIIISNGDHNFSDKATREKLFNEIISFLN